MGKATAGGPAALQGVLKQLRPSEQRLKELCGEVEQIGGPEVAGTVRQLLEKERGVQAALAQLAARRAQLSGSGASSRVDPYINP